MFLVTTVAYGIAFGEAWKRGLGDLFRDLPDLIRNTIWAIGMYIPMLALAARGMTYHMRAKQERVAADDRDRSQMKYQHLGKATMGPVLVATRVSAAVLVLCLLVSALVRPPTFIVFGTAFLLFFVAAVELFSVYFFPDLLSFVPANKIIARIVNISPLSAWDRKPASQLMGAILFGILTVAALTRALGYW